MFAMATSSRMAAGGPELESQARLIAEVIVAGIVHPSEAPGCWSEGAVEAMRAAAVP